MLSAAGATGATGAAGATGATPTNFTKVINYGGNNVGFQRIAGSPGALSNMVPYVDAANGSVVAFSAAIDINNLTAGTYWYQVCFDVINTAAAPVAANIISTITLTTTATLTGTIIFSIRSTDVGAQPVRVSNGAAYIVTPNATVTWTSNIAGNPVTRNDAISLFLNMNVTQNAVYSVYISSAV